MSVGEKTPIDVFANTGEPTNANSISTFTNGSAADKTKFTVAAGSDLYLAIRSDERLTAKIEWSNNTSNIISRIGEVEASTTVGGISWFIYKIAAANVVAGEASFFRVGTVMRLKVQEDLLELAARVGNDEKKLNSIQHDLQDETDKLKGVSRTVATNVSYTNTAVANDIGIKLLGSSISASGGPYSVPLDTAKNQRLVWGHNALTSDGVLAKTNKDMLNGADSPRDVMRVSGGKLQIRRYVPGTSERMGHRDSYLATSQGIGLEGGYTFPLGNLAAHSDLDDTFDFVSSSVPDGTPVHNEMFLTVNGNKGPTMPWTTPWDPFGDANPVGISNYTYDINGQPFNTQVSLFNFFIDQTRDALRFHSSNRSDNIAIEGGSGNVKSSFSESYTIPAGTRSLEWVDVPYLDGEDVVYAGEVDNFIFHPYKIGAENHLRIEGQVGERNFLVSTNWNAGASVSITFFNGAAYSGQIHSGTYTEESNFDGFAGNDYDGINPVDRLAGLLNEADNSETDYTFGGTVIAENFETTDASTFQGPQGRYRIYLWRSVSHGASAPAAPTITYTNGSFTVPSGWLAARPSIDAATRDLYEVYWDYDPSTQSAVSNSQVAPFKIDVEAAGASIPVRRDRLDRRDPDPCQM